MTKRLFKLFSLALLVLLTACGGNQGANISEDEILVNQAVRVLDEGAQDDLLSFELDLGTGEGELRFSEGDPLIDELEPGLILVSDPIEGEAPNGFLQKIESKSTSGGEVVFATSQATLLDTFNQAQIDLEQELTGEEVVDTEAYYDGVSFAFKDDLAEQASTSYDFSVSFDEVLIDGDGNEGTTNDQLRVNGSFDFDATASASIDIDCDCFPIPHPYLNRFAAKVRLEESVDVTVEGELAGSFDERYEVARFDFGTFTVWAGPVPVVFVVDMVISVGADGSITAHLEAGATQSSVLQVGAEYRDSGGWDDLNEFAFDFDFPTPTITAAGGARAFLRPQLNIKIYGLAGPYAYAEAFVSTDAELYRAPFWRFTAGVDVGLGFVIDLPVVGTVGRWETEVVGFEQTLQESVNEAPSIQVVSPSTGDRLRDGQTAVFEVTATDREQETVEVSLVEVDMGTVASEAVSDGSSVDLRAPDLCIGDYEFRVTGTDDQGDTDHQDIHLIVENMVPDVEAELEEGSMLFPDGFIVASATAVDWECSASGDGADPDLIQWYLNGTEVGTGEELVYRLPDSMNEGDALTLRAEYADDYTVGKSEDIDDSLIAKPAGADLEPRAIIRQPDNGSTFNYVGCSTGGVNWTVEGVGIDVEDGELEGGELVWEIRAPFETFIQFGTGKSVTLNFCDLYGDPPPFGDYQVRLTVTDSNGNEHSVTSDIEYIPAG